MKVCKRGHTGRWYRYPSGVLICRECQTLHNKNRRKRLKARIEQYKNEGKLIHLREVLR